MKSRIVVFLSELFGCRAVLWQLVAQQLTLRYRRTVLGYLWTLINPLLMMSVMAVVFSALFKVDLKEFSVFLFAGMIPWNFFNSVVTQSGAAFINNEGLIKKIYLPKAIFPLSIAIALLIDGLLSFAALFAIIVLLGGGLSVSLLFLPFSFLLLFFFAMGVSLVMSIVTVFFRDLQYVTQIAMQGLFFLTPVVYKNSALSGGVAWVVGLNPVTPFIALFRSPLVDAVIPDGEIIFRTVAISSFSMIAGLAIFVFQEKKIIFRL